MPPVPIGGSGRPVSIRRMPPGARELSGRELARARIFYVFWCGTKPFSSGNIQSVVT